MYIYVALIESTRSRTRHAEARAGKLMFRKCTPAARCLCGSTSILYPYRSCAGAAFARHIAPRLASVYTYQLVLVFLPSVLDSLQREDATCPLYSLNLSFSGPPLLLCQRRVYFGHENNCLKFSNGRGGAESRDVWPSA